MRSIRLGLVSVALLSIASQLSAAENSSSAATIPNHHLLQDDFIFAVGGYYSRNTTAVSLGPSGGGTGLLVDFEDTLDLQSRSATPIAGFLWRASDRWRLAVDYFSVNRSASNVLAQDITWGDYTFNIGDPVNSSFNFTDWRVSAVYAFFKRPDKEVGVGLGVHVAAIETSIQSTGIGADSTNVTAPLPVVSFYGMFALTDEWALSMNADWLSLTYGEYSGDVRNISIDAIYQPFKHVGFGLGLRSMTIDMSVDTGDWDGKAKIAYQGPTAFVTVSY